MIKNTLLAILCILCSVSCNHPDKGNAPKTDTNADTLGNGALKSISVLYYNYGFDSKALVFAKDLKQAIPSFEGKDYRGVLDAEITDPRIINETDSLIKCLEADTSIPENGWQDARIVALLRYENGKQDTLSFQNPLAYATYINGIAYKPNHRLIYLVKNSIGYYAWFIGDRLFEMKELRDNSFVKEPFGSNEYYKTWQRLRNED